jgi:hypothetical protein
MAPGAPSCSGPYPDAPDVGADCGAVDCPRHEPEPGALVAARMNALDALIRVVLDAAEAAIDKHPGLTRAMRGVPDFVAADYTAEVTRCRLGYTVACQVYSATNTRTRTATRITGFGETLADASAAFIDGLDAWAAVLK